MHLPNLGVAWGGWEAWAVVKDLAATIDQVDLKIQKIKTPKKHMSLPTVLTNYLLDWALCNLI